MGASLPEAAEERRCLLCRGRADAAVAAEDAGGVPRSGRCAFAAGAAQTARQQREMITA